MVLVALFNESLGSKVCLRCLEAERESCVYRIDIAPSEKIRSEELRAFTYLDEKINDELALRYYKRLIPFMSDYRARKKVIEMYG